MAALLLSLAAGVAHAADKAKTLVATRIEGLPAIADERPVTTLFASAGRLLAATEAGLWMLDPEGKAWARIEGLQVPRIAAVATGRGAALVLAGAADAPVKEVLAIDVASGTPVTRQLAALPEPLSHARAAFLGANAYVVGVRSDASIALYEAVDNGRWTARGTAPASGQPIALVGQTGALHLFVRAAAGDHAIWRWKPADGWEARGRVPGDLVEGSVRPSGNGHILALVRAPQATRLDMYHTITGAWAPLATLPAGDVRAAAPWKNAVAWTGPGNRLWGATLESSQLLLGWLDWLVLGVYIAAMVGIGLYFYKKEKRASTADFFVGGRSIPFWAAGVSLYATNTSSISFIAIPAKAFETNWTYLANNLTATVGLVFVAIWIVPLLRRLDLMSVFHYLEIRFHPSIRLLSSMLCILMQIGSRMSVILFLPSLAIATVTGIPVTWSVLIMGVATIIYTALGGMKAVIWTDFAQIFVMIGGIVFAIVLVVMSLDGGVGRMIEIAAAEDKTKLLDFSFDLTKATVWGFIFLVLFDVVLTFPKDQVLMQRVLSTRSARDAGRSVWMFAAIMIPAGFLFYMVGTALYAFYKTNPERMNPTLAIDATFPLFIAAELPMGVRGLIVAGIFAAAMSTLSSIMNSVATLASVDFYERWAKPDPRKSVIFAEVATMVTGVVGIGAALLLSRYDVISLFDVSIELAGLLGGGFAGAYTLGMFTRRANWQGVAIGIGSSIALTFLAWSMNLVHPYFYLGLSIMLCIVIGYAASCFFPPPSRSLQGLTIYDRKERMLQ